MPRSGAEHEVLVDYLNWLIHDLRSYTKSQSPQVMAERDLLQFLTSHQPPFSPKNLEIQGQLVEIQGQLAGVLLHPVGLLSDRLRMLFLQATEETDPFTMLNPTQVRIQDLVTEIRQTVLSQLIGSYSIREKVTLKNAVDTLVQSCIRSRGFDSRVLHVEASVFPNRHDPGALLVDLRATGTLAEDFRAEMNGTVIPGHSHAPEVVYTLRPSRGQVGFTSRRGLPKSKPEPEKKPNLGSWSIDPLGGDF